MRSDKETAFIVHSKERVILCHGLCGEDIESGGPDLSAIQRIGNIRYSSSDSAKSKNIIFVQKQGCSMTGNLRSYSFMESIVDNAIKVNIDLKEVNKDTVFNVF